MTTMKALVALTLTAGVLAGCGATGAPTAAHKAPAGMQARADQADVSRPKPPTVKVDKVKQGFAAREAARLAERSLYDYNNLIREWERAWSDAEKDRIEQRMLSELHNAIEDVQRVTSAHGSDSADRRAYDIADAGLDRYDRLFREWEAAWSQKRKREIINDMLSGMVRTLQDVKNNY